MEKAKFTKGNWTLAEGKTFCAIRTSCGVIADMRTVNGVYNSHNANLIAAAPDMYELLDSIYIGMCSTGSDDELVADIGALLAKARGE